MYKLLLCWRYLLTRYIALASIISVMLGVATMIVVNAVMLGFTTEMQDRIHGIISDVTFESTGMKGFPDAPWHMEQIRAAAGDLIEDMAPTVGVPGMLTYRRGYDNESESQPIELIGIDQCSHGRVSEIMSYLQHPENRKQLDFKLRNNGYDDHGTGKKGPGVYRFEMGTAGWEHRRYYFAEMEKERKRAEAEQIRLQERMNKTHRGSLTPKAPSDDAERQPYDPFAAMARSIRDAEQQPDDPFPSLHSEPRVELLGDTFDPAREQHTGAIIGIGLSAYGRYDKKDSKTGEKRVIERLAMIPGDDVYLTFPTVSLPLKLQSDNFTIVDLYESKMMEYDSRLVFVPLEKLQQLRGMYDPTTGKPMVTKILIKARPGANLNEIRDRIRAKFPPELYQVRTWRDTQEVLLAAVYNELAMLNVLLFLIFAVAGFGILAIFYMIVVEKTKDIGIMKSLGAGGSGIMQIFLYYSLLLGVVGAGLGLVTGLLFVRYIKEIANVLSYILQSDVFSPEVYSFYEIPTIVQPATVAWIIAGAISIAVASGILPAVRAARLHPVESLRS